MLLGAAGWMVRLPARDVPGAFLEWERPSVSLVDEDVVTDWNRGLLP